MEVETLARWAGLKGINLLGTGDFTHPLYLAELKSKLIPSENGLFSLKRGNRDVSFILTGEVSNIFKKDDKVRRIHTIIFAPSFEVVEKINIKLSSRGKLSSDGRPVFGFPVKDLVKLILDISSECLIVPAHAWTPWFSIFGSNSGFDSIEECFEGEAKNIYSIETGLSSDPEMNWRLSSLDRITLISNSDAHSPNRIGREANIFNCKMDYKEIVDTIKKKDRGRFLSTIEFFPEEGKYHYDGHRRCNLRLAPKESIKHGNICPVCEEKLTIGVMHRVEELADREEGFIPPNAIPSKHLIPLEEIIAEALGYDKGSKAVEREYMRLIELYGSEFNILMDRDEEEFKGVTSKKIIDGIMRVRKGDVFINAGYDGKYGEIKIFKEEDKKIETKNR
jgi:uncharacterized protein (TIGR00375 family)